MVHITEEGISNDMGMVIAASKGDTMLDSLKLFAAFDRAPGIQRRDSRCTGVEFAAKEYAQEKCPPVKTLFWKW